jgi:hypothetical protein
MELHLPLLFYGNVIKKLLNRKDAKSESHFCPIFIQKQPMYVCRLLTQIISIFIICRLEKFYNIVSLLDKTNSRSDQVLHLILHVTSLVPAVPPTILGSR